MTDRAKKPYEGMTSYDAGYRDGYVVGHDDATRISEWVWNEHGVDYDLGAWQCDHCGYRNVTIPLDDTINPYTWAGTKYCAECGCRMINMSEEED